MNTSRQEAAPNRRTASVIVLSAVFVSTFTAIAFAAQNPPRDSADRIRVEQRTRLRDLITGPVRTLQGAMAGGAQPTAEILLTPVADSEDGPYGHGGYYSAADIKGNRLTVSSGNGRTFWNMQIRNWGSHVPLFAWQGQINAGGFLGANSDCGGGSGSCASAGDLRLASQPCAHFLDCRDAFGDGIVACLDGMCDPAWVNSHRSDFDNCDFFGCLKGCSIGNAGDVVCWRIMINRGDSRGDDGLTWYRGTLALDVPADAKGIYTISWVPEETFMLDDSDQIIPLAALVPGQFEIALGRCCYNFVSGPSCAANVTINECDALHTEGSFPVWEDVDDPCPLDGGTPCDGCLTNEDCDDADSCTSDKCTDVPGRVFAQCKYFPLWPTTTHCCNAATGDIEVIAPPNICTTAECEFDGNRGRLIITPLPVGTPCSEVDIDDLCTFDPVCQRDQTCAGTHVNDAHIPCGIDDDCRAETGIDFSRCARGTCVCSLDDQLGACCSIHDPRVCVDDAIEDQCDCFGCAWTPGETCQTINCQSLIQRVPAASTWSLFILALTLLTALTIKFSRRYNDSRV